MNALQIERASAAVNRLTGEPEGANTPEIVRQVIDEAKSGGEVRLLTAYAWHLQGSAPCPRDARVLLSRFVAYAEAEADAWDLGGEEFSGRHGFPPNELSKFRGALIAAAVEVLAQPS